MNKPHTSGEQPTPRVGVGAFVFRDGKFLMQQRRGAHGEGTWSVPGGHLDFGETPEETAVREVMEETGCEIEGVQIVGITNDIFKSENKHYVTIWTTGRWKANEPIITEPEKCTEQLWVNFDTLPDPLFLPWEQLKVSEFIEQIKEELERSKV